MNSSNNAKCLTCKVCGFGFFPDLTRHYISRDKSKTGVMAAFSSTEEPELFDSYDCPSCGSQVVAQEHKRIYSGQEMLSDIEILKSMDDEIVAEHLNLTPETVKLLRNAAKEKKPLFVANKQAIEQNIFYFEGV